MKKLFSYVLIALSLTSFYASAVTIIAHPSNKATLDESALKKIFLGKSKTFPDGSQAVPVDLSAGGARDQFVKNVLGKSESQIKAYWSKLIFTGKGQAPKAVDSEEEVIKLISQNPNLIGYVSDGAVNDSVKVVAKF